MSELNLKMIKIFFVVVMAMLVVAMISGMDILRGARFIDWKKVGMELDYLQSKNALGAEKMIAVPSSLANSEKTKSVPILLYHGIITDKSWEEDGTNITLDDFRSQMFALKKEGYRTITLADFYEFMKNNRPLPEKAIMITFDDGRKDSYYNGDPVLKAVDYSAVMFLITGRSLGENVAGDNFYLGKSELKDMIQSGRWEIQSHGDHDHDWEQVDAAGNKGHFMSNLLWIPEEKRNEFGDEAKKRILSDLQSSKEKIESELGQKTYSFAYPFNDFGQESKNFPEARDFIAQNISRIYPLTFYQEELGEPIVNIPDSQNFMMKRIDVSSEMSMDTLMNILRQNREKNLPFYDTFWNDQGWRTKWGTSKIWDNSLNLGESEPKGGSMTVLLGTSLWKDYFVKSKIQISSGSSVSQIVRYKSEGGYAACSFEPGEISIYEKSNGQKTDIAVLPGEYASLLLGGEFEIGAEVKGSTISCYLNGRKMLQGSLRPASSSGGIGLYTWDDLPENASIQIKKVVASPL